MSAILPVPHPVSTWIAANAASFDFARSLQSFAAKRGGLTIGQIDAADRLIAKAQERAAMPSVPAVAADVSAIETAFATARQKGAQKPRLRVGCYVFKPAPATGKNPGAIYATRKADGTYLGKFMDGEFKAAYMISSMVVEELVSFGTDPHAAAVMHGKEYGTCAICGRELSDPESVTRGIGPICADKFGW